MNVEFELDDKPVKVGLNHVVDVLILKNVSDAPVENTIQYKPVKVRSYYPRVIVQIAQTTAC